MIFRRKKKMVMKKPRLDADQVIIGAAKTIGTAVGTASGAYEIGRQSASEARNIDTGDLKKAAVQKKMMATKQAKEMQKQASKQAKEMQKQVSKQATAKTVEMKKKADEAKKMSAKKADETKKLATAKAMEVQAVAMDKVDNLREAAADKIAPKKKRGLLARLRS